MTDKGEIVGQLANLLMKFVNKGKSVTNIYLKVAQNYSCMASPEKIQMLAMTQPLLITVLK